MGFQRVEGLLLAGDLLEHGVKLGFSGGVVRVIGIGNVGVLLQRKLTLEKFQTFLLFGKLLLKGGQFGGIICLFLRFSGGSGLLSGNGGGVGIRCVGGIRGGLSCRNWGGSRGRFGSGRRGGLVGGLRSRCGALQSVIRDDRSGLLGGSFLLLASATGGVGYGLILRILSLRALRLCEG